jgi:hypothetical protein
MGETEDEVVAAVEKKTQRQVFWYEGRGEEELDLRDRRN